jgi:hypothetical protein
MNVRYTYIIAGTALVVGASVAGVLLSARTIVADVPNETRVAPPSVSITVMKIMEEARGLPAQQYDAI